MRRHLVLGVIAGLTVALAGPVVLRGQTGTAKTWAETSSPSEGFRIDAPGTATTSPDKPGHYAFGIGKAAFLLDVGVINDVMRQAVVAHDRSLVTKYLEAMRDGSIGAMDGARRRTSNIVDIDGWTAIKFAFDGVSDSKDFDARELIALTDQYMYILVAIG